MKKLFFLMPLAALALASCSSDETQSVAQKQSPGAVNFIPAMNGSITRGTIFTDASFASSPGDFEVIASGYFYESDPSGTSAAANNITKEYNVTHASGAWTLDGSLWWGDASTSAKFTAFAPSEAKTNLSVDKKTLDFAPAGEITSQKDLVVAYNEGSRTAFSSGVPLHFRHALSQIVVRASYKDDPNYDLNTYKTKTVKIKQVRFRNIAGSGTLTLPTAVTTSGTEYVPVWTPAESNLRAFESTTLSSPLTLNATAQSILGPDDNAFLLVPQEQDAAATLQSHPSTGTYIEAMVSIVDADGAVYPKTAEQYAYIAVPVATNWKGGYKYTYTLNFSNVACGKVSPNALSGDIPDGKAKGDDVVSGVPYPVNFLVTVEDAWSEDTNSVVNPGL